MIDQSGALMGDTSYRLSRTGNQGMLGHATVPVSQLSCCPRVKA